MQQRKPMKQNHPIQQKPNKITPKPFKINSKFAQIKKTLKLKVHFSSRLKNRLKKGWVKVLNNGVDSLLLHPQQRTSSLTHWQALLI
ncbi:hypothetical protein FFWV33_09735 [Flavobacterium faecale]|uniref:Uncharacterized protein n=1 Tax=Flavobacterium faecale TaxID=1355330 RepID=A0A2S1LDH3_9FLAO|nr:hypothetical protein FFWV33_09735 [Flavobacterium faecale]